MPVGVWGEAKSQPPNDPYNLEMMLFPRISIFEAAAIFDFNSKWIWHVPARSQSGALTHHKIWFKISYSARYRHTFVHLTSPRRHMVNFRFKVLVIWLSPFGFDASSHRILYKYLHRIPQHFRKVKLVAAAITDFFKLNEFHTFRHDCHSRHCSKLV